MRRVAFDARDAARALSALVLACAGACAAPRAGEPRATPPRPPPALESQAQPSASAPSASPSGAATAFGYVDGEPLELRELLQSWFHAESLGLGEYVERMVNARLVRAEAQRLEIEVDARGVDELHARALEQMAEVVREGGGGDDLREYVELRLGIDPERYFERVRADSVDRWLAERVVRAFVLQSERAEVRVIVLPDEAAVQNVKAALERGEDFGKLAREHSIDESGKAAGRVPPVVRSPFSPLAQLAFLTPVGEVGGPVVEGGRQLLIRVEAHAEPLLGKWPAIAAEVERSLARQPIEELEFGQWRAHVERRHAIDLSPLSELLGETP